jgi:DNA-directed RNA polymerase subunit RPC12/RpoP
MSYLDEVAICPYNSNHVFAKSRLFPHLQKCKDAIKSKKPTLFCKNDSSLRFFEEDKQNHYIKCKYCAPDLNSNNIDQIGDWGLGIGDWGLGPIPNPQSPIPNPQKRLYNRNLLLIVKKLLF